MYWKSVNSSCLLVLTFRFSFLNLNMQSDLYDISLLILQTSKHTTIGVFLPLDEPIASTVEIVVVSGRDGRTNTLLARAKLLKMVRYRRPYMSMGS